MMAAILLRACARLSISQGFQVFAESTTLEPWYPLPASGAM